VFRRCSLITVIVGTLLTLINQLDAFGLWSRRPARHREDPG